MSTASNRFYPRAPRYTLRSEDDNQMRFALMQTKGSALGTELKNVSSSGLAFTLWSSELPKRGLDEGDMIKIEFKIPTGKQIACFATVTRVDHVDHWTPEFGTQTSTEVAVQFRNLPEPYLKALQTAVASKGTEEGAPLAAPILPAQMNTQALMLLSLSSVALFSLFVFLSTSPQEWLALLSR